jgi:outer membrane cobalamin receptor
MLRSALLIITLLTTLFISAQNHISGTVTDTKGHSIPGANVYIDKSYDGTSTDANGEFKFTTQILGKQSLIVSCIGYMNFKLDRNLSEMQNLRIVLKESVNSLNAVVITAGTFSAGDNSKITALKPLDVLTTAGAAGNYIAAFQSLPGTTTVGESGELFIRGGDGSESQTFIDGMRVFKPYSSTANNIPSRGRYSTTLFKGMTFSTGGYSAEYGQALSGILLLDTKDNPVEESTEISIMSVGASLGKVMKKDNDALSLNVSYINLAPYNGISSSRDEWKKSPEVLSGETVYRHQYKKGLFKFYSGFGYTNYHVLQKTIDYPDKLSFETQEKDLYLNTSYKGSLNDKWLIYTGVSYGINHNKNVIDETTITDKEENGHFKFKLKHLPSEQIKISIGADYFFTDVAHKIDLSSPLWEKTSRLKNQLAALYTETNILFSKNTVLSLGARGEYSNYSHSFRLAPRVSIAQKTSRYGQVSFAWGEFYQLPQSKHLQISTKLKEEKSQQFLLNYQYNPKKCLLRAELFYKKYSNLIKYDLGDNWNYENYTNQGSGYAKGLDIFWKDEKNIHNFKYWISYSYLDTERDYRNFPEKAKVNFSNKHNLSIVGKYWIPSLRSQVGMSYKFASGRPYNDPNESSFMKQETKNYNNLSLNWSWLITQQTIFYCSATNILGHNNIFTYDYSNQANANGRFDRQAVRPNNKHFFFAGLFISISRNKMKNQLDNL